MKDCTKKQLRRRATSKTSRFARQFCWAAMLVLCLAEPAFAQTPFDSIATYILGVLTGGLARSVAIIAIVALGYMAFIGYLTWMWAFRFGIGIVLVFGGAAFADLLIGSVGSGGGGG